MATIDGTPRSDVLIGTEEADSIFGFIGKDSLSGNGGNDSLNGGVGNDTLDGGIGIDTLNGGAGNDTYIVDSIDDTIAEASNTGTDTVQSSISYELANRLENSTLENLTLTGTGALNGTGNSLNNIIIGNAADNYLNGGFASSYDIDGGDILYGGDGNDTLYGDANSFRFYSNENDILYGGDGNDTLYGVNFTQYSYSVISSGNDILYGGAGDDVLYGALDTLDGGSGNDTLQGGSNIYTRNTLKGGTGNDTYIIFSTANTITEASNSGTDTVQSAASYALGSNLENLTLTTEAGASNGTGNGVNNTIIGNDANNILSGGAGNDNLNGQAGNDTLLGSAGSVDERDTLTGGAGIDTFILGDVTRVFYDDRNRATAGKGDYALITDFNTSQDIIKLNGLKTDYFLASSPSGSPAGTAIYLNKPSGEKDELIAIVQGSASLNLNGNYFQFKAAEINPSTLNGSNGFVINGINAGDNSGSSVSEAGDVNGDGFSDLLIGANGADPNGQESAGSSYVVFGKAAGFGPSLNLSSINGSNGFVINGIKAGDRSGGSVSEAGDVNGDGFSDLIIGASFAAPNGQSLAGESYVVFGKVGGFGPSLNLSALNGSNGFALNGINADDLSAGSVSEAGDINSDGFSDLIIGAFDADPNGRDLAGESYVVFGKLGGFSSSLNLSNINGSNGFKIDGIDARDRLGSVSSAGDVNGDGFSDLIIGAFGADPNGQDYAGSSYVVFGKAAGFGSSLNLSALNGSNGFVINGINAGDSSGSPISSAGDVNGDGFSDLIIGASGADPNGQEQAGSSYVVFGKAAGFSPSLNLSALNGSNGFVINGINSNDFSGRSLSAAGDVNGDGFDDLLIGANGADPNDQDYAGSSYVVFGKAAGFGSSLNLSDINGSNGFVINGIDAGDRSGFSVSEAGDVNGDGFDDLIIGAYRAAPNGQYQAGESYVIFGRDFTNQVTRAGTQGNDTLTGTTGNDILVSGLGNDILVGGKGSDVLIGGGGNDTLSFGAVDRRINGGSGTDTLQIDTSRVNLDLTTISNNKITEIEKIDLTGTGNNSLMFNRLDVLDLSDTTNRLIVNGNAGDAVTSTGQGWIFGGKTTLNGILYDRYTVGAANLLVDADITQTIT